MRTNHCQREILHGKHATHAAKSRGRNRIRHLAEPARPSRDARTSARARSRGLQPARPHAAGGTRPPSPVTGPRGLKPAARWGFTLVELMVVVGIIGLLVAIVLPAVSSAWDQAKAASTGATLNVLETGLTQFFADTTVGGAYPPSTRLEGAVYSPYTGDSMEQAGGANFLVWATAGADLLGTAGFRDLNNDPDGLPAGLAPWAGDIPALYAVEGNTPLQPRSGPFVEISKIKLSEAERTPDGTLLGFRVPVGERAMLEAPVFLDSFGQPILYYRATTGAANMAVDFTFMEMRTFPDPSQASGIYNLDDNAHITGSHNEPGIDLGAGPTAARPHPIAALTGFGAAIVDARIAVPGVERPHRADSFILLSAGRDGLYGTADDIANFPTNK